MIANWVVPLNVLLVALSTAEHNCGENEKWTECTGCELSCGQDEDTPCTANCRPPSCYCAPYDNLRRDPDGKCIPNEQCPQTGMGDLSQGYKRINKPTRHYRATR
ncbi:hypothetical protein AB6A40_006421 [Gnathostoma spinigerum]|uniref:TIL domain-containing protein n=1 Tax=Gnathostoma spinigerum TaxID=75299 RepID=A0ABD6ESQ5_9BILA